MTTGRTETSCSLSLSLQKPSSIIIDCFSGILSFSCLLEAIFFSIKVQKKRPIIRKKALSSKKSAGAEKCFEMLENMI